MGRGNVCVTGSYEGLFYIDNDDLRVYSRNAPHAKEEETSLQRDLSCEDFSSGEWLLDEIGSSYEEEDVLELTKAEKFVSIRKLAESGFLTESRLRKMHKQGKPPGIWCGKKFLVNVPLLNEELDRESKKQLSGGGCNESHGAISD